MELMNSPLTNEAAKTLMALDVQDKEILTYEKLDEWYTACRTLKERRRCTSRWQSRRVE